MRDFVETQLMPHVERWDSSGFLFSPQVVFFFSLDFSAGEFDKGMLKKAYDAGVFSPHWPAEQGGTPPEGGFDTFMDLIWIDELMRCGASGVVQCFGIRDMALPPLANLGTQDAALTARVVKEVVTGEKMIALCISEPSAGSDVASLQTSLELTPDGAMYVLNGEKKWITCAYYADYFTVACKTIIPGEKGISLILCEREAPGVKVRRMKMQGNLCAGTSYVTFEDVNLPKTHLMGTLGTGFKALLLNFNHERFVIAVQANRCARICLEEAIGYSRSRKTFGKKLSEHQVIRHKVAEMARQVEATHALLEQLAWHMESKVKPATLGKYTALAKVQASRTFEFCAREASQIFGGSSYVREGRGLIVERLYREVRSYAIPGGSEEIMNDLAMKQARL